MIEEGLSEASLVRADDIDSWTNIHNLVERQHVASRTREEWPSIEGNSV